VLLEAGIEDCDLMIAVTQSDETNLVACKLAQQLFNVPTRIVRLRATDYLSNERCSGRTALGVDSRSVPSSLDRLYRQAHRFRTLQVLDSPRQGEPGRGARLPGRARWSVTR